MSDRPYTRIPGHSLLREGRAFDRVGDQLIYTGERTGIGVCECGETSAILTSTNGRRSWHKRIHKAAIQAQMGAKA